MRTPELLAFLPAVIFVAAAWLLAWRMGRTPILTPAPDQASAA